MAPSFIAEKWSAPMTLRLPVTVTNTSPIRAASTKGITR